MHEILIRNPIIDVNKRDSSYNTPIHYILKKGKARPKRCELLMTLLQTGRVDVNALDTDDNTPLHIAAEVYKTCIHLHTLPSFIPHHIFICICFIGY